MNHDQLIDDDDDKESAEIISILSKFIFRDGEIFLDHVSFHCFQSTFIILLFYNI